MQDDARHIRQFQITLFRTCSYRPEKQNYFFKNKLPFKNTLLKTNWAESVSHAYLFTRERESFFVEREKMKSEIVRLKEHKKKAPKKV